MDFIVGEYYRSRIRATKPNETGDVIRCIQRANSRTNFADENPGEWEHVRIVPVAKPTSFEYAWAEQKVELYTHGPDALAPPLQQPDPSPVRSCQTCDHYGMGMDMDPYCAHPAVLVQHSHGLVTRHALPLFCGGENHNLWTPRKPR